MSKPFAFNPKLDFAIERFIDSHAARLGSVDDAGASQGVVHAQALGAGGSKADLATNQTSGFYRGTEMAVDQFVEHVIAMK